MEKIRSKAWAFSVVTIVALAVLAGCIGSDATDAPGNNEDQQKNWPVGTWWTFDVEGELPADWMAHGLYLEMLEAGQVFSLEIDRTADFVVVEGLSEYSWGNQQIASSDRDFDYYDYFGLPLATGWWYPKDNVPESMDLSKFSGYHFLDLPLEDGKSWSMSYMLADLDITAHEVEEVFEMVAELDGNEVLRYTFDPEVTWLTEWTVMDLDGEVVLEARMTEHGEDYSGTVTEIAAGGGWMCYTANPGMLPVQSNRDQCKNLAIDTIEDGESWFFLLQQYHSEGTGHYSVLLEGPDDMIPGVYWEEYCPCDTTTEEHIEVTQPGRYKWTNNVVYTEFERNTLFWIMYFCADVHQMTNGTIEDTDLCDIERYEGSLADLHMPDGTVRLLAPS